MLRLLNVWAVLSLECSTWTCLKVLYLSQLMHTNYFNCKTVKTLKTIIFATACFGLHKPSSGRYSLHFAKVTILIAVYKSLLKYSVLWLLILFSPVVCVCVYYAQCIIHTHTHTHTTGVYEISSHNTEYFNSDLYIALSIVTLAKRRL